MGDNGEPAKGLAWPGHGTGPTPRRQTDRRRDYGGRRKPAALWDRIKILLLLLGAWGVLVWGSLAGNPVLTLRDSLIINSRSNGWLLVLAGLEVVRQIHYFISERSARYNRFWTDRVFQGLDRRKSRLNDWNRFRIGRAMKWLLFLVVIDLVIAKLLGLSPAVAIFQLPIIFLQSAPFILQLAFGLLFGVIQIFGIFYFLSRGGTDVYFPDDIKTRFDDV